ncbi:hypothetical protein D3C73_1016350 [compost metagenome]
MKGNSYLFYVASGLVLTCFVLISTFIGSSPFLIALFLIFGNVGQSFILIALSNAVSRTLPKEQAGVGMGLFFMLNFISQGIATGIFSKMVVLGSNLPWNPANNYSNGFIYSNIFLVLAGLLIVIVWFYYWQFGRETRKSMQSEELKLVRS